MLGVDFSELPFDSRPDLSPFLMHFTRRNEKGSAFENLVSILKSGLLYGSDNSGFIKGKHKATCFMDVPFGSLKYILTESNSSRYEPYGILVTKTNAYKKGVRPVLYLSNEEYEKIEFPSDEKWRVVRFEVTDNNEWISFFHEREWRCKGDFKMPGNCFAVMLPDVQAVKKLQDLIEDDISSFRVNPQSLIPLNIICQGLNIE